MSNTIIYTINNGVATICLNRPEKYNAFNEEMAQALKMALTQAEQDEQVRAVMLTAKGKAFCAGQDLGESATPTEMDFKAILEKRYNPIIVAMRNMPKPVITAINGVAAGAGANLALAGDIVLASSTASFIQAFINIGLIPDCGGTYFLPRLIGLQRAMALAITGDKISADEALGLGMVYQVYSDSEFEDNCQSFAQKIAQKPTQGIALTKRLMYESLENNLQQQLVLETEAQVAAGNTYDFKEGVTAFLEKRPAQFKGH